MGEDGPSVCQIATSDREESHIVMTMTGSASDQRARRLLGQAPRPRVMIVGRVPPQVEQVVRKLAPTVGTVEINELAAVRWQQWDAAVTAFAPFSSASSTTGHNIPADLWVLAFVPEPTDEPLPVEIVRRRRESAAWNLGVSAVHRVRCDEFYEPDRFTSLAHSLIATVRQRERYWTFHCDAAAQLQPLLEDADHKSLAAWYFRNGDGKTGTSISVVVPADVAQPDRWVTEMFRWWARAKPEAFGAIRDWEAQDQWWTREETAAHQALAEHDAHRAAVVRDLGELEDQLQADLQSAQTAARAGSRRLLTGTGDSDLVPIVIDALRSLGFVVEDIDARRKEAGEPDRLHDLEVTDPDEPGWVALAEVKGYEGGAKSSDLMAIGRHVERFVLEHQRTPSARWYVVNQFRAAVAEGRPPPLYSNPGDVEVFAQAGGAVIDTRTLFRLVVTHEGADSATLSAVRAALRERTGMWPLDESAGVHEQE